MGHLEFEPVEELQGGGGARPIQNLAQFVEERHAAEDLEAQPAQLLGAAAEDERVPPAAAPVTAQSAVPSACICAPLAVQGP